MVDDHALVRGGIASLLAAHGVEVVGEAGDGLVALEKVRTLHPDIVLMDLKMPRCDGLEATRRIKAEIPQTKIIVLTVSDDDEDLFEAIKSGAEGFLLKNMEAEKFISLLSGVSKGEAAISPNLASKIIEEFSRQKTPAGKSSDSESYLTDKELDILRLVSDGSTNKEMANVLNITDNTVKYHLRHIMEKLHLNNRAQLAAYAVKKGLTSDSPNPK